jgi:hypothetical protein
MYSESDLEAAVAAGALTAQQAASFRDFTASKRHMPVVDEEHFRLLTGFNDIFVSIAAVILLVAVAWIGHYIGPNIEYEGPSPTSGILVAGTAWGLAEFFTRQRRMALPSIILLLAFVGGVFATVAFSAVLALVPQDGENTRTAMFVLVGSAAVAAGGAWLHWRRFKVPITVAAGVAALVALVLGLVASAFAAPEMSEAQMVTMRHAMEGGALLLGIGVFLFAMRWDSSDPRRETRRSDVAFWLHLLAAPLIVHPIFSLLGLTRGSATPVEAAIVVLLYVVLGLAALAIDRRALLVSALAYVLYALNSLFETYGAVKLSVALTALVIGSALLLLSAFWTNARRAVVRPLPRALQARLPVLDRVQPAAAAA